MNDLKSVRYDDIYCIFQRRIVYRYLVVCSLVVHALLMLIAGLALQLAPLVLRPATHTQWVFKNHLTGSILESVSFWASWIRIWISVGDP